MKTKKSDSIAYYNQVAHSTLLANISREAERLNQLINIWNKLEVESLEEKDLPRLIQNDSGYFRNLYRDRVWAMIDALKIPTPTKQKLMEESQSSHFPEFIQLMENASFSSVRKNLIPIAGGFKSFELEPEYFEMAGDGKVTPAKDVEAKTAVFFQILTDTPEKAQAVDLLHDIAEKMTVLTGLLDSTGLYAAKENPIIGVNSSALFSLQDGEYKPRIESLL